MSIEHPPLIPGALFGGDFELLRPLGEGGMGVVWLACERSLDREVALKIMRPADGSARLQRFAREARALAALDHPSILPVLHTGTDESTGLPYLVTRAVLLSPAEIHHLCHDIFHCPHPRGFDSSLVTCHSSLVTAAATPPAPLTLADLLDGGKQLPESAVLRIARDLADALSAAHAAGILHRDCKPSNILFDPSGRAILSDFGLAKFTAPAANSETEGQSLVTRHSSLVTTAATARQLQRDTLSLDESGHPKFIGSPSYAAPEALREGAASASPALDWYSFGAVLHEALTGDPPRALRPLSSYASGYLSRFWEPFLRDLLEPDPVRRLQDSAAIRCALDRIARHPARRRSRRWFWPGGFLGGLGILGILGTLGILGPLGHRQSLAPTEPTAVPDPVSRSLDASRPILGVRGVVEDASLPNPVTDFSRPRTDSAPWLSVPASLPAGTERRLPLGSEPDRLRLLWCPPKPGVAPEGFWILAEPISTELAAAIHNHFAEKRTTPVWRAEPETDFARFDRNVEGVIRSQLSILAGFFGHERDEADVPVANFELPTNAQIYYARSVCRSSSMPLPDDYVWTRELDAVSHSDDYAPVLMPLQPILVRAVAR